MYIGVSLLHFIQEHSQEIVIDNQYLLEQKYSNMLQDVLTQKQMVHAHFVTLCIQTFLTSICHNDHHKPNQNDSFVVFQELFESPSIVQLLKSYQDKKLAMNSYASTDAYSNENETSQQNTSPEQKLQIEKEGEYFNFGQY